MRLSPLPRKKADLADSTCQQLNMYAFVASAAGVSVLALALPSEAKIVYTPAHEFIGPNQMLPLDLNHDGIADFSFHNLYSFDGNSGAGTLNLLPSKSANQVWVSAGYAAALAAGVRVGPKRPFASGNARMAHLFVTPSSTPNTRGYGPWQNATNRYLGLKFVIGREIHFGWARLSVRAVRLGGIVAVLTGYAYETLPNKPIFTGKTMGRDDSLEPTAASHDAPLPEAATLGLLALGSPGLSVWRREESVANEPRVS